MNTASSQTGRRSLAPSLEEMALFAQAIGELAGNETSVGRVALAHTIRNRAIIASKCGTFDFGDGTLSGACRTLINAPAPKYTLNDPVYCRDLALACRVWSCALPDPTSGATHFHSHQEEPAWALTNTYVPVALIGGNVFYRTGGNQVS